jgi:hypothetical protein
VAFTAWKQDWKKPGFKKKQKKRPSEFFGFFYLLAQKREFRFFSVSINSRILLGASRL